MSKYKTDGLIFTFHRLMNLNTVLRDLRFIIGFNLEFKIFSDMNFILQELRMRYIPRNYASCQSDQEVKVQWKSLQTHAGTLQLVQQCSHEMNKSTYKGRQKCFAALALIEKNDFVTDTPFPKSPSVEESKQEDTKVSL